MRTENSRSSLAFEFNDSLDLCVILSEKTKTKTTTKKSRKPKPGVKEIEAREDQESSRPGGEQL